MIASGAPKVVDVPHLAIGDVLVFGTTPEGFHSSGVAGWAFKGSLAADWHVNSTFRESFVSRQGLRAEWGRAEGPHSGAQGGGYGIVDHLDPIVELSHGTDIATYRKGLEAALAAFLVHAASNPTVRFVITLVGVRPDEGGEGKLALKVVDSLWTRALGIQPVENLLFPPSMPEAAKRLEVLRRRPRVSSLEIETPRPLKPAEIFVGGWPKRETPLRDKSINWVRVGERLKGGRPSSVSRGEAKRRYESAIVAALASRGHGSAEQNEILEAFDHIVSRATRQPVTLVTMSEVDPVNLEVLKELLLPRVASSVPSR